MSAVASLDAEQLKIWQVDNMTFRAALLQVRNATVLMAVSMKSHLHFLHLLEHGLRTGALIACVLAVLAAWLTVRWGHAPLRRIGTTMKSVTSDNLDVRIAPSDVPVPV